MEKQKREKLEKAVWKLGSAEKFLRLTSEEAELVEIRIRGLLATDIDLDGLPSIVGPKALP